MNEIIIKIFRRSFVAWAGLGFLLLIVSLSEGGGEELPCGSTCRWSCHFLGFLSCTCCSWFNQLMVFMDRLLLLLSARLLSPSW